MAIRLRALLARLRPGATITGRRDQELAEALHRRPILIALGWAWYAHETATSDEGRHEASRHIAMWDGIAGSYTLAELMAAWQTSPGLSAALGELSTDLSTPTPERVPSTGRRTYPPYPQTDDDGISYNGRSVVPSQSSPERAREP